MTSNTRRANSAPAEPIAFGRREWPALTGTPMTTCTAMVSEGLVRSLKVGKRRLFLYQDVKALFERLAERGEALQPRKIRDARLRGESQPPRRGGRRRA